MRGREIRREYRETQRNREIEIERGVQEEELLDLTNSVYSRNIIPHANRSIQSNPTSHHTKGPQQYYHCHIQYRYMKDYYIIGS